MNSLRYSFEELPDFWDGEFRSGSHNGYVEICYSVCAIVLDCHNGKIGNAAKGKLISLSRAYQSALWEALCESLDAVAHPHIQHAVNRALAEDGISMPEPQAEHKLRTYELS